MLATGTKRASLNFKTSTSFNYFSVFIQAINQTLLPANKLPLNLNTVYCTRPAPTANIFKALITLRKSLMVKIKKEQQNKQIYKVNYQKINPSAAANKDRESQKHLPQTK